MATSKSIPGVIRSRYSTTVILDPSLPHTLPISNPITPAPTTTRCSGISVNSRAPVESIILLSLLSTGAGGNGVGSEPVAITIFFALIEKVRMSYWV